MSNFNKHVSSQERQTPYPKIIVNPIEQNKKHREDPFAAYPATSTPSALSLVASYFQKLLRPILSQAQSTPSTSLKYTLTHLMTLRKLLTQLTHEDCSHQPQFNHQLAKLWHILMDDCNKLPTENPSTPSIFKKIKFLISQINNFPIGSDYTLGYYLSQEVGRDWNPFPCMGLLKGLHDEFTASPLHSTLHNWILLIDDVR